MLELLRLTFLETSELQPSGEDQLTNLGPVIHDDCSKTLSAANLLFDHPKLFQLALAYVGGTNYTSALSVASEWLAKHPRASGYFSNNPDMLKILKSSHTSETTSVLDKYFALFNENNSSQELFDGLLALRTVCVHSGSTIINSELSIMNVCSHNLTDEFIMNLHSAWGTRKFNTIFNKGVIQAITNESNASHKTLALVATVYDTYPTTNEVSQTSFFAAFDKFYDAGYTSLKFSDLYDVANNLATFQKYTATNAIKLMASTGGSWSAVTGLGVAEFTLLTSPNAAKAIDKCGATFKVLEDLVCVSEMKTQTLLSDNAISLCSKGYKDFNFNDLSKYYGTTYWYAGDAIFGGLITPDKHPLYGAGVTFEHAKEAGSVLNCIVAHPDIVQYIVDQGILADSVFQELVSPANLAGLEAGGSIC